MTRGVSRRITTVLFVINRIPPHLPFAKGGREGFHSVRGTSSVFMTAEPLAAEAASLIKRKLRGHGAFLE
jgi:hypothetical protein